MNTITPTSLYKKIAFVYQTTIKESEIEEAKVISKDATEVAQYEKPKITEKRDILIDIKEHKNQLNNLFNKYKQTKTTSSSTPQVVLDQQQKIEHTTPQKKKIRKINIKKVERKITLLLIRKNKLNKLIISGMIPQSKITKHVPPTSDDLGQNDDQKLSKLRNLDPLSQFQNIKAWKDKTAKEVQDYVVTNLEPDLITMPKFKDEYDKEYDKGKLKKVKKKKVEAEKLNFQKVLQKKIKKFRQEELTE